MSWWAFTFPLTATAIATSVAFQVTNEVIFKYIAFLMLTLAIVAIGIVAWFTIMNIKKGEICVKED